MECLRTLIALTCDLLSRLRLTVLMGIVRQWGPFVTKSSTSRLCPNRRSLGDAELGLLLFVGVGACFPSIEGCFGCFGAPPWLSRGVGGLEDALDGCLVPGCPCWGASTGFSSFRGLPLSG
eukprot:scaffold656_cov390-Prasinococcus_capsulatus_cf.AAC.5